MHTVNETPEVIFNSNAVIILILMLQQCHRVATSTTYKDFKALPYQHVLKQTSYQIFITLQATSAYYYWTHYLYDLPDFNFKRTFIFSSQTLLS